MSEAATVRHEPVVARDRGLVRAQFLRTQSFDACDFLTVVVTVEGRLAALGPQQLQAADARNRVVFGGGSGRGDFLDVEGKRSAIARPRRVRRAALIAPEQVTGAVLVPEHHQASAFPQFHEAFGLTRHIDVVGREKSDQLRGGPSGCRHQAREIVTRERNAQVATAVAASRAAKRERVVRCHGFSVARVTGVSSARRVA